MKSTEKMCYGQMCYGHIEFKKRRNDADAPQPAEVSD